MSCHSPWQRATLAPDIAYGTRAPFTGPCGQRRRLEAGAGLVVTTPICPRATQAVSWFCSSSRGAASLLTCLLQVAKRSAATTADIPICPYQFSSFGAATRPFCSEVVFFLVMLAPWNFAFLDWCSFL